MTEPISAQSGTVRLSLKVLAIGGVLVGLTSLVTLVVVVSVKNVDGLSTLALSLAVLAFVVQLIVYIVQSADASRQLSRSQELHSQMMGLLAQIQERTRGTEASIERINSRMLEAIIGKATSEGIAVESPEFARRLAAAVGDVEQRSTVEFGHNQTSDSGRNDPELSQWPSPLRPDDARRIHQELSTWPDALSEEDLSIVTSLSDDGLDRLSSLALDARSSTRPNSAMGPGLTGSEPELEQHGLVEKVPGWKMITLSDKGRRVARLLTADGEPRDEFLAVRPARDRLKALKAASREENIRRYREQ